MLNVCSVLLSQKKSCAPVLFITDHLKANLLFYCLDWVFTIQTSLVSHHVNMELKSICRDLKHAWKSLCITVNNILSFYLFCQKSSCMLFLLLMFSMKPPHQRFQSQLLKSITFTSHVIGQSKQLPKMKSMKLIVFFCFFLALHRL